MQQVEHKLFKVSVQALIYNEENKFLILKNVENKWLLPGGRIDEGENDFRVVLEREMTEETNHKIKNISKEIICYDSETAKSTLAIVFKVEVEDLSAFRISHEHNEIKWISNNEAKDFLFYRKIGEYLSSF